MPQTTSPPLRSAFGMRPRLDAPERVADLLGLGQDVLDHATVSPAATSAPRLDARVGADHGVVVDPRSGADQRAGPDPDAIADADPLREHGLAHGAVGSDADAVVEDRALDGRVAAHAAMIAENGLRPDVGAARQAAVADQGPVSSRGGSDDATRPESRSQVESR